MQRRPSSRSHFCGGGFGFAQAALRRPSLFCRLKQGLAADRFGGEAGLLHAEFGLGDAVEGRPQAHFAPVLQLAAPAILVLEEDRWPRAADRVLDRRTGSDPGGEQVQPLQMA